MREKIIRLLGGFTSTELDLAIKNSYKAGKEMEQDRLALKIFERGGFATVQLSESGRIPSLKFVPPDLVTKTNSLKLNDGKVIVRGG